MKHTADAILRPEQATYLDGLEPLRDALLAEMEAFAASRNEPISDPEVASFLFVAARAMNARRVVEVGTNIGYGAIVLARAAPRAEVITLERSSELVGIARGFIGRAGLADRVTVREGDALAELDALEGAIDFAYIDCVKEDYPQYLDRLLPRLESSGVIVADNVLWRGLVAAETVPDSERARVHALREFNRRVTSDPQLRGVILPLGDGVAYAVKLG